MQVTFTISKKDLPGLIRELQQLYELVPEVAVDGMTILFFRTELNQILVQLARKLINLESKKKDLKVKFKPSSSYVLYCLVMSQDDEIFLDPLLMRNLLGAIDKVAVRWRPIGKRIAALQLTS